MKFKILTLNNVSFFLFLYLTLIIGFFYGENLNYGSYGDWVGSNREPIKDFANDFTYTLLNFDSYGHRHSPVYLIFLSLFLDLGLDLNQIRILHLHLCISLIVIFYQCLRLIFTNINNNYLFLLSMIIFLSPTFRSLAIWPDSRMPGLIFFVLTIYFFLKFRKTNKLKYSWYTCISLVVSSYISPNFSIFFPYFFFFFLKKIKFKELSFLIIFNFLASLPILYYIFILDVNFLAAGTPGLNNESINFSFNLSNKLMIISSIIFFHLSPILIMNNFFKQFKNFLLKKMIILIPLVLCLIYFFNYQLSFTGGGIFFILSNLLFNNNYLFYIGSFFFISFLLYIASLNINNFFLLTLLIVSNIQNTIYHKYYEPLILIMFFTLIQYPKVENLLKKRNNILYLYLLSFIYILMRVFKINYLV